MSREVWSIQYLSKKGFKIAIDDFGTGYSNLGELKAIQSHVLKIDRSFITDMEENSIRSTLIPHIVEIASQLNMKIVAEGIENPLQQEALLKMGISYGQGWLFAKPLSVTALKDRLQQIHPSQINHVSYTLENKQCSFS